MNTIEYADPATQRAAVDPTFKRPVDPAMQRTQDRATKADGVIRDAESSRSYPRAGERSDRREGDREVSYVRTGVSGLDVAGFVLAAIMVLGPLLAGALASMHS